MFNFKLITNMKTLVTVLVAISVFCLNTVNGQDYKHNVKSAKKIEISNLTGEIKIIGHNGTDLEVYVDHLEEVPARAKGLKPLSGGGVDNSGIGLNVTETGNVISVMGTTKQSGDAAYTFKVPNSIAVEIDYTSPFTADNVIVEDFDGEFEMGGLNDGCILKNVTGPVFLDLINGDIEIIFTSVNQASPMSIKTINGDIDLSIPTSTKANFELYSLHGDIYTDLDIKMEKKNSDEKNHNLHYIGGMNDIEGTINGGGVKMKISTINGNLFLRKK